MNKMGYFLFYNLINSLIYILSFNLILINNN